MVIDKPTTLLDNGINLLKHKREGIIGWDWDGTLSANGVDLLEICKPIIKYFKNYYGWCSVIITGRSKIVPISVTEFQLLHPLVPVLYNKENSNSYRFKFYVLRKLFASGRGVLRLYIDNQAELTDAIRKNDPEIPVSHVENYNPERLADQIRLNKKLFVRMHSDLG